jgi:CRISPR-associated endonuclease/helicase Cas3
LNDFLSKSSLNPSTDRILIATQVVEAGVDTTASCLMTELAPWPSLVQRFGRSARYGGRAEVVVLDHGDEKQMAPYQVVDCVAARGAIDELDNVAIGSLEDFEAGLDADRLRQLYPFQPLHVLLRHEFEELFDTSADLSGADIDISRYVRDGDDARDLMVFWRDWDDKRPTKFIQPRRDELCSVSIIDAKKWLKKIDRGLVWVWDYLVGQWDQVDANRLRPGMTILVDPGVGGYDVDLGFTGAKAKKSARVPQALDDAPEDDPRRLDPVMADAQEDSEAFSQTDVWKTIATHCGEATSVAQTIMRDVKLPDSISGVVELAMRLHDWGKAHPAFSRGTYRCDPVREDLAKAPDAAWRTSQLYRTETHGPRSGFRHELASCLATLELLRGAEPKHPAILGPFGNWLKACELTASTETEAWADHPLATELRSLSRHEFNLLLFLIAAHHGKVRASMQASPKDQDFPIDGDFVGEGYPIRGVREGDMMPATVLPTVRGEAETPELTLSLSPAAMGLSPRYGASWSERMSDLLRHFGPFTLGYLEAIVRAADGRASDESRSPGRDADPHLAGVTLTAVANKPAEQAQQTCESEEPAHV